jgi:hypothetical protein
MPRARRIFTYSNVAASLALVLALGGTSYALTVTSTQIKNATISSVDLKNGGIRLQDLSAEVKKRHEEKAYFQHPTTRGGWYVPPAEEANLFGVTVASMFLPKGAYVATASLQVSGGILTQSESSAPFYNVDCFMTDPNGNSNQRTMNLAGGYPDNKPFVLHMTTTARSAGQLKVRCSRSSHQQFDFEVYITDVELTVVEVDQIVVKQS